MKGIWILPLLILPLFFTKEAVGIRCYQCNTLYEDECHYLRENSTMSRFYRLCEDTPDGSFPFCRKIVQKIKVRSGLVRVVRSCGWEEDELRRECYRVANEDHEEMVCQCFTDGCNTASDFHYKNNILLYMLTFISFLIYYFQNNCY